MTADFVVLRCRKIFKIIPVGYGSRSRIGRIMNGYIIYLFDRNLWSGIGLEGEVVQCIPTSEISYATNSRNVDTISIECCHPDETGQFNTATYDSAVKLTAWLCTRFGLTSDQVIRHYDVTGKDCPKYYVENPDAWIQMKSDIAAQIQTDYALQGK